MKKWFVGLLSLVLFPCFASANGVSPVLNLFHRDSWLPATVVTIVIILAESLILRWRIKTVRFHASLWRSVLFNAASSTAGSVILVGLGRDSFFMSDSLSLVIPLFIITLIVEIPLLHWLYRDTLLDWQRASVLGFGINATSYAAVFICEILFLIGWLGYADRLDERERTEWRNPYLLTNSSGFIYATESKAGDHGLRRFDFSDARWVSLTNCPSLDPNKWDIQGRICAFSRWSPGSGSDGANLVIASLPDFMMIREISLHDLREAPADANQGWQGLSEVAVSPDGTKVAVLFRVGEAVAYRNQSSYYMLGSKCKLAVFDVESGREIGRAKRWISEGLCWFPDSQALLFSSFLDESLYETPKEQVRGSVGYGIGHANDDKFERRLFSLLLEGGSVQQFAKGDSPQLAANSRRFMVLDKGTIRVLDMEGNELNSIRISRLGFGSVVPSPDANLFLAQLRRNSPFHGGGRLTIFDFANSLRRHILSEELIYKYCWTPEGDSGSTNHHQP